MSTIYLIDLEAVETRYTGQWKTHIPTKIMCNTEDDLVALIKEYNTMNIE